jgi:hypothetical protein
MGIFIGSNEVIDSNFDEVYVGSNRVWPFPIPPPEAAVIRYKIPPTVTESRVAVTGAGFTIEQDGVVHTYSEGNRITTGLNSTSFITLRIPNTTAATTFELFIRVSEAHMINLGRITSLEHSFSNLTDLRTFTSPANTSNIINLDFAWINTRMSVFPTIDTSNVTTMESTWAQTLVVDFPRLNTRSVTNFKETWARCHSMNKFQALDFSSGTNFESTWNDTASLTCIV